MSVTKEQRAEWDRMLELLTPVTSDEDTIVLLELGPAEPAPPTRPAEGIPKKKRDV